MVTVQSIRPHAHVAAGVCVFASYDPLSGEDESHRTPMDRILKIRFDIARDVFNAVNDLSIEPKATIPFGRLQLLVRKSESVFVLPSAVDLLSRRDHGKVELARKLVRKGFSRESAQAAIETLATRGYQDDHAAAESWIRSAMRGSGRSRAYLLSRLTERGFSRGVALEAIDGYERDDPSCFERAIKNNIKKIVSDVMRRDRSAPDTPPEGEIETDLTSEQRKTVITRLLRRGFSTNDIQKHFG